MTPAEIGQLYEGYLWRRRQEMLDMAAGYAVTINASLTIVGALTGKRQRTVKAADFLPKDFQTGSEREPLTVESVQRELAAKVARFAANARKKQGEG